MTKPSRPNRSCRQNISQIYVEDTCFNVLSSRFLTHGNGVTALELDLEQTNLVPGMMK